MRNKFPGPCFVCGKQVIAGEGYFQRIDRRWKVRCRSCVGKGNAPINLEKKPLDKEVKVCYSSKVSYHHELKLSSNSLRWGQDQNVH